MPDSSVNSPFADDIPFVPEGTGFANEDGGMQCKAQNVDGSLTPSRLCNAAMRPQDRSQASIFGYEGYIPFNLKADQASPAHHFGHAHGPAVSHQVWPIQDGPYWSPDFCGGAWLFTRYSEVSELLRDRRFSVQRAGSWVNSSLSSGISNDVSSNVTSKISKASAAPVAQAAPRPEALSKSQLQPLKAILARALLFVEGKRHTRLRHVINAGFKPAILDNLVPFIENSLDDLIAPWKTQGQFDFVQTIARPIPSQVIARLLGIPQEHALTFLNWSENIAQFIASPTPTSDLALKAQDSVIALNSYFDELMATGQVQPGQNLINLLLQAQKEGKIYSAQELLSQCVMLLFAGYETTRHLLSYGLFMLLNSPTQLNALRSNSDLIRPAVRELLRLNSPVQYTARIAKTQLVWKGQKIERGQLCMAMIGAANHDPQQFSEPERFNIARQQGQPLSFGAGPHICLGAALTYLEAEVIFKKLFQKLPDLQLNGQPEILNSSLYRGLSSLPLKFAIYTHRT